MSLKNGPALELLHITVECLFLNAALCRAVPIWYISQLVQLSPDTVQRALARSRPCTPRMWEVGKT